MVTRFEGGTLDAAVNYPVTDFIRLRDDKDYTALTFSAGNFSCFGINCQLPPWDNKPARQALLYAVDRVRWANTVQKGMESPSTLPWPKTSPAYDDAKANAFQFDLDKAAAMLKAAGVSGPLTGDVIMPNSNAELTSFAQILQGEFAKLGITLTLKPQDTAAYLYLVNNWKYQGVWLSRGSFAQLAPATSFTKSRPLSFTPNTPSLTPPLNAAPLP